MKKLGFVVEGISNLKVLGPVIEEAISGAVLPYLLISVKGGGKSYDVATRESLRSCFPALTSEQIFQAEAGELARAGQGLGLHGIVMINAYSKYVEDVVELQRVEIATFGLDYFVNSLYAAAWEGMSEQVLRCLRYLTVRLVISDWWRELEHRVLPATREFQNTFVGVGTPMQALVRRLDREQAKKDLRLPSGTIITCLTPNIRRHQLRRVYGWRARSQLHRSLSALRRYCQARGHHLVIKGREKQWEDPFYLKIADTFMTDDQVPYPPTSARLAAASDLVVHFGSMVVMETAAAGVPAIAIGADCIDALHSYMHEQGRTIIKEELFGGAQRSLFNFNPVTASVPFKYQERAFADLADALLDARQTAQAEYSKYNETFFGKAWTDSPRNVMAAVARHL